jgi:hypothetical protein
VDDSPPDGRELLSIVTDILGSDHLGKIPRILGPVITRKASEPREKLTDFRQSSF